MAKYPAIKEVAKAARESGRRTRRLITAKPRNIQYNWLARKNVKMASNTGVPS
jgi:hypothetical protein